MNLLTKLNVEAPYLYRFATSIGIPVLVKDAKTGEHRSLIDCAPGSFNYKDKFVILSNEVEKISMLRKLIEEHTIFVYTKEFSFRVSKDVSKGDVISIGNKDFFRMISKEHAVPVACAEIDDCLNTYPVLEIFDVNHTLAISA